MPRRRCYNSTNPSTVPLFSGSIVQRLPLSILAYLPALFVPPQILITFLRFQPGSNVSTIPPSNDVVFSDFYTKYQQSILDIIQYIIDRVSLDTVLKDLQALQSTIQTRAQAERVISNIEEILLGVVDNITHKVSLHIVLGRLQYVTNLLATVDSENLPVVYGQIAELLAFVIDQITNREGLVLVLENLTALRNQMTLEIHLAKEIIQVQEILIGVVENVINRVSLHIVLGRLQYVQLVLASIKEGFEEQG
jgi:hypothetical protein